MRPTNDQRIRIVGFGGRHEILGVDAVGKPVRCDAGIVAFERLQLGARCRRAQVEATCEAPFLAFELLAFDVVAQVEGKRLVARVLQPFLRIHVAEIEDFGRARHIGDVLGDRRAVDEDEIVALPRQRSAHRSRDLWRVEIAHRRGRRRRQAGEHAQHLHRIADPSHLVTSTELRQSAALVGFLVRAYQRGDVKLMAARKVADHVERSDLPAALGRERKPMANVEHFHGVTALSSSATSAGSRRSR